MNAKDRQAENKSQTGERDDQNLYKDFQKENSTSYRAVATVTGDFDALYFGF